MLLIFRGWYFCGFAAIGCVGFGVNELNLALNAATEPEAITMAELEQGKRPSQPFVSVDDYYAVYGATAYETKGTRVKDAFFPMLSSKHPWCLAWDQLATKYDDLAKVPNGEMPALDQIKVMGLTDEFKKLSQIPDEGRMEDGAIGIFYTYDDCTSDERELIAMIEKDHPEDVVVIEIGRKPKSVMFGAAFTLVGVVLAGLAIMMFRKNRTPEPDEDEEEYDDDEPADGDAVRPR